MEPFVMYTREEVADLLKVSLSSIGNLIRDKELYIVRIGRSYRIPDWSLQDFVEGKEPRYPVPDLLPRRVIAEGEK